MPEPRLGGVTGIDRISASGPLAALSGVATLLLRKRGGRMSGASTIISGGLSQGALLALISVGFVIIYRATKVVSFAQGAFMALGGLVFARLANSGLPLVLALIIAALVSAAASALIYRLVLARVVAASPIIPAVASIGIGIALLAICELIWKDQAIILNHTYFSFKPHDVVGLEFGNVQIFTILLTVAIFVVLIVGIQFSPIGLKMRAVADQPRLAAYIGIRTVLMASATWGIAGACAALAGSAYTIANQPAPDDLFNLGLLAFPAILLGGLDSIAGALIGSIALALIQNVVVYEWGGNYQDVVSYGILLVILLVRPQGMLGRVEVARV